jgi:hypothetical protein
MNNYNYIIYINITLIYHMNNYNINIDVRLIYNIKIEIILKYNFII